MTYISSTSRTGSAPGVRRIQNDTNSASRPQQEDIRAGGSRGADSAELSPVARYLSELKAGPAIREDLVARVREDIESGTYETPEKLDAVLDDLAEDIAFEL